MNSLLGLELSTPVNFIVAFVVVLGLIGAATWAVRRFGGGRFESAARGRQPRLAVIDSAAVDARRKLLIVRRDNVEHLLMIGGPTDVVVESNIVRANAAAPRDMAVRSGDTLPRAIPLPDPTPWPVDDDAPPPPRAERIEPELAPAPLPQPVRAPPIRPAARVLDEPFDAPPQRETAPRESAPREIPHREPPRPPAVEAPRAAEPATEEPSLTDMALRLEAALRRPMAQPAPSVAPSRPAPPPPRAAPIPRPPPRMETPRVEPPRMEPPRMEPPRPEPARPAMPAEPATPPDATRGTASPRRYESFEQEMANLLGRPPSGKT